MTHPQTLAGHFKVWQLSSNDNFVAFRLPGNPVAVREVNPGSGLLHQSVDVLTGSSDQMRMERIAYFHCQRHSVSLGITV